MAVYFYFGRNKSSHFIFKIDEEYEAMKMIYVLTVTEKCYTAILLILGCQDEKGEFVLVNAVKAYWGSRGIAPFILNLGTGWRCVKFHASAASPPNPGRTSVLIE
jgi:hypothetical protein